MIHECHLLSLKENIDNISILAFIKKKKKIIIIIREIIKQILLKKKEFFNILFRNKI